MANSCKDCIYRKVNDKGQTVTKNGVIGCTLNIRKKRTFDEACSWFSTDELGAIGIIKLLQTDCVNLLEDFTGEKFNMIEKKAINSVVKKYTVN